jgi:formylmethanofuran dehydrogenase subunit E
MIMKSKPYLEQSMQEEQIREALNKHWHASAAGDANAEHDIYDEDAVCDYPQSGERILGQAICGPCGVIIQASRLVLTSSEFSEKVISGSRNTQSPTRGDQHTQ